MLGHQLPQLPELGDFLEPLAQYFEWLNGTAMPELPSITIPPGESLNPDWRPPDFMSLPAAWGVTSPIEAIRFAGANQLCVEIDYSAETGERKVRLVEPYSFRMSSAGNTLFYGLHVEKQQIRAYRVNRIIDVKVTKQPFHPKWRVEF